MEDNYYFNDGHIEIRKEKTLTKNNVAKTFPDKLVIFAGKSWDNQARFVEVGQSFVLKFVEMCEDEEFRQWIKKVKP